MKVRGKRWGLCVGDLQVKDAKFSLNLFVVKYVHTNKDAPLFLVFPLKPIMDRLCILEASSKLLRHKNTFPGNEPGKSAFTWVGACAVKRAFPELQILINSNIYGHSRCFPPKDGESSKILYLFYLYPLLLDISKL